MSDDQEPGSWIKRRFKWKEALMQSQDVSRGAKHLGVLLCDKYVDRKKGTCWPSNETLAGALAVRLRTIQRHVKALKEAGWLREIDIPKRRRGLKLSFPRDQEDDKEDDRTGNTSAPFLSPEHDKTVAANNKDKEPSKNQGQSRRNDWGYSVCHVGCEETLCISEWQAWLAENTTFAPDQALKAARRGNFYQLPSRYPSGDPSACADYVEYFEAMLRQNRGA